MTADELRGLGYDPTTGRRTNAVPATAEPSAVERQKPTGSDRRAAVALREPGDAGEPGLQRPTSKYHNRRTPGPGPLGGERLYASKREAGRAAVLAMWKRDGDLADWFPQVSFEFGLDERGMPARYVADFMEVLEYREDGTFVARLTDTKGMDTPASKAKRQALRARGMRVGIV